MLNTKPEERLNAFHKLATRRPELTILTDQAIGKEEAWLDSFDLHMRLGPVFDVIRHPNTKPPMAVAIYGDWGTGKTTAMKWLHSAIEEWNKDKSKGIEDKCILKPVWFYPWKYHKQEDVWRGLVAEVILKSIDVESATLGTITHAAKQFGMFLGRSFLHVLAGVNVKGNVGVAEGEVSLAGIKEILEEYREVAHPEKAYLNDFEATLKTWLEKYLGERERMVIFIDDLDRCLPDVALEVLEALKLYLNLDKLIFVVGVDDKVINQLIQGHYEDLKLDKDKSGQYLAKMFQVEVALSPSMVQVEHFLYGQLAEVEYWKDPKHWLGCQKSEDHLKQQNLFRGLMLKLAGRNPREVKRLINSGLLFAAGAMAYEPSGNDDDGQVAFNQGLQVFLIQRILGRRYSNLAYLIGDKTGTEFFKMWSGVVCLDKDAPKYLTVSTEAIEAFVVAQTRPPAERKTGGMGSGMGGMGGRVDITKPLMEKTDLEKARPGFGGGRRNPKLEFKDFPEAYRPLIDPKFRAMVCLLTDQDLGALMTVPFSPAAVSAAQTMATASLADFDPNDPIVRAIASRLDKPLQELTASDLTGITEFRFHDDTLKKFGGLSRLSNVTDLDLSGCTGLTSMEDLSTLQNLKRLDLQGCTGLTSVDGLSTLQNLHILDLRDCTGLTSVEDLAALQNLQTLVLSYCMGLTSVESLAALQNLQTLVLSDCTGLTSIEDLAALQNLQTLVLFDCMDLTSLKGLAALQNLQTLVLSDCTGLTSVEGLAKLQNLQRLHLSGCTGLTSVEGLAALQNLQVLYLDGCTGLTSVEGLAALQNLHHLDLRRCTGFKDVPEVLRLRKDLTIER